MENLKRLNVAVYRFPWGDCTNGGVTAVADSCTLFFDCTKEMAVKYCEENNITPDNQLFLVKRKLWNEDHFFAEPLVKPKNARGARQMFGGNYIMSSDSRFPHQNGLTCAYPIPVHDRYESEQ